MEARLRLGASVVDVELQRTAADRFVAVVEGDRFEIRVEPKGAARRIHIAGTDMEIRTEGTERLAIDGIPLAFAVLQVRREGAGAGGRTNGLWRIRPPMTGRLDAVVAAGQRVAQGDVLFVLEAMKMRNEVRSPAAGTVAAVHAKAGDAVEADHVVVEVQAAKG
jgi:biotin carboxyl carrier protein